MPALSRIEKELIFSNLVKEKSNLYIKHAYSKISLSHKDYITQNHIFKISNLNYEFVQNMPIIVYFFYKKVKVYFKTILEKEKELYFKIPEKVYIKKKKKHNSTFPSMNLYYQNFLLSTFLSANLIKNTLKKTNTEIKNIFTRSHNMGHNLSYLLENIKRSLPEDENLYSHIHIINDFLIKKEKGLLKKGNLYLFSDSSIILLFSSIKLAKQFASSSNKNKKFIANISFKNRNISCNVTYDFFSPFIKNGTECNAGFLGLKIDNIQEEDKRYLYEGIFSKQYGTF